MASNNTRAWVLDATAFYAGVPFTGTGSYYTTPQVVEEVRHIRPARLSLEGLIEGGRLQVLEPSKESMAKVRALAGCYGAASRLSEADLSVLALALTLRQKGHTATILSDDYTVENLASLMGLGFKPTGTTGIRQTYRWVYYCPGCGRRFREAQEQCDVCGSRVRRRRLQVRGET